MKKLSAIFLLISVSAFSQTPSSAVKVNPNTGVIQSPTNFAAANGILTNASAFMTNGGSYAITLTNGTFLPTNNGFLQIKTNDSLMFVGDSVTRGIGATNTNNIFGYYFSKLPYANGAAYRNSGVAGWKIADITSDYNGSVKPHRPAANGGDGGANAYLMLMIGINDIYSGTNAITNMISSLNTYVTNAQADGFKVVLSTILDSLAALSTDTKAASYLAFNNAIKGKVISSDYVWDAASVVSPYSDTNITTDGTHPNDIGNIAMAYDLAASLRNGGGKSSASYEYLKPLVSTTNAWFGFNGNSAGITIGHHVQEANGVGCTISSETNGDLFFDTRSSTNFFNFGYGYGGIAKFNSRIILSGYYIGANNGLAYIQGDNVDGNALDIDPMGYYSPVNISRFKGTGLSIGSSINPTACIYLHTGNDNPLAGSVTLTLGSGTITSSSINTNTVIFTSLKTPSGTNSLYAPLVILGSGSATLKGGASDNGVYNWAAVKLTNN